MNTSPHLTTSHKKTRMDPSLMYITPTCAAAMLPFGVSLFAALNSPSEVDAWASVGASMATMISVIHARKADKSLGHLISVAGSSWFCGITFPYTIIHLWAQDHLDTTPWQGWAILGFMVGLIAWGFVSGILALWPKVTRRVEKLFNKMLGE